MVEAADSYLLPIPSDHRSDWGEAFLRQLDERLRTDRPASVDRAACGVKTLRRGMLSFVLARTGGEDPIKGLFDEDNGEIRCGGAFREFALEPPDFKDWIPSALGYVQALLRDTDGAPQARD